MLNLFDFEPPSPEVTQQYNLESELRHKHYEDLLIGKTKREVIELLGKPETIFRDERPFTVYPGKIIEYDERWSYWFRYKGVYGRVGYSVFVYLKNDVVIYAGSG